MRIVFSRFHKLRINRHVSVYFIVLRAKSWYLGLSKSGSGIGHHLAYMPMFKLRVTLLYYELLKNHTDELRQYAWLKRPDLHYYYELLWSHPEVLRSALDSARVWKGEPILQTIQSVLSTIFGDPRLHPPSLVFPVLMLWLTLFVIKLLLLPYKTLFSGLTYDYSSNFLWL